jgi:hypothetical protein
MFHDERELHQRTLAFGRCDAHVARPGKDDVFLLAELGPPRICGLPLADDHRPHDPTFIREKLPIAKREHMRFAHTRHSVAVKFVREDYVRVGREGDVRGTTVEVGKFDGQQKRIPASVVRIPFYDPDKTRPPRS